MSGKTTVRYSGISRFDAYPDSPPSRESLLGTSSHYPAVRPLQCDSDARQTALGGGCGAAGHGSRISPASHPARPIRTRPKSTQAHVSLRS